MSFKNQKNCSFWQRRSFVIDFSHTHENVINATDLKVTKKKRDLNNFRWLSCLTGIYNYTKNQIDVENNQTVVSI